MEKLNESTALVKKIVLDALEIGIYPRSFTRSDGIVYERDNYGDGWDDACLLMIEQIGNALDRLPSISDELAKLLVGKYCYYENELLFLNLNDTFYWASADCEIVEESDIPELGRLARVYGWAGTIYWASEKRNCQMPEIPRYRKMVELVRELEGQK